MPIPLTFVSPLIEGFFFLLVLLGWEVRTTDNNTNGEATRGLELLSSWVFSQAAMERRN